jgi:hypothetical protein
MQDAETLRKVEKNFYFDFVRMPTVDVETQSWLKNSYFLLTRFHSSWARGIFKRYEYMPISYKI